MRHPIVIIWLGLLTASLPGNTQHVPSPVPIPKANDSASAPELTQSSKGASPKNSSTDNPQRTHLEKIEQRKLNLAKNNNHQSAYQRATSKQGRFVEEQRKHLRRMAQIRRLIRVAIYQGDRATAALIRQLQKKEMNRHALVMRERNEHIRKQALKKAGKQMEPKK